MRLLFLPVLLSLVVALDAQSPWMPIPEPAGLQALADQPLPAAYQAYQLDLQQVASTLTDAPHRNELSSGKGVLLVLPDPDGVMREYIMVASKVMHPDLAARYPEIRTFSGFDPKFPARWVHLDLGPKGFHAMVTCPGEDITYIDPLHRQTGEGPYLVYAKADYLPVNDVPFTCLTETAESGQKTTSQRGQVVDEVLRTYRLALACTGEYATFHGGTKADALAAMVVTINRINGLYEREFGVWLELIADNDKVIYLDPATDPFNNNNLGTILGQNQTNMDNVIGSANYDIGHVFGTAGGGLATLESPCNNNNKARAATGLTNPIGDVFDVDYVAHEMGHQFGCDHTFNNACSGNRNNSTAWEPGSGNTIMAYTGICAPNIQDDSDPYFHGGSLVQARIFTTQDGGNTCPVKEVSGNQLPTVEAGPNYTIPRATPFELTAVGSDPDGDILTYTWEQFDNDIADMPPSPANANGPTFKSVLPDTVPVRIFPALQTILNNTNATWEVLPAVGRVMNFRATVRDNHPGHGLFAQDAMIVNVDGNSGPFQVTNPNFTFPTWRVGDTISVTWNVANTDQLPVACSQVDILLSLDGGYTWPIVLGDHVANDGEHTIVVPLVESSKCRVKIKGVGNIFFDISNFNFAIKEPVQPTFLIQGTPDQVSWCRSSSDTLSFTLTSLPLTGFSDTVFLSLNSGGGLSTDLPDSLVLTENDTLTFRVWDITSAQAGPFPMVLSATNGVISRQITFQLELVDPLDQAPVLLDPADNLDSIVLTPTLSWTPVDQAEVYLVEIGPSPAFGSSTLLDSLVRDTFLHVHLTEGQIYYWRVTARNACEEETTSTVHVFRTQFAGCKSYTPANLPITIPNNAVFTFNSTVSVPDPGTISDVNVFVNLTHTYLDDVSLRLIHPGGTALTLVSKVCDNGQDILATFDDDGEPFACSGQPAVSGTVTPENGDLSVFNGLQTNGTWTLRIIDDFNQDGGTMNEWRLELCQQAPLPDALLLEQLDTLWVPYCSSAELTADQLMVDAVTSDTTDILFTLRIAPEHGTLTWNGMNLVAGDVFSQSEIDGLELTYVHDGSGFLSDDFMLDALRPSDQGWLPGIVVPVEVVTNLIASVVDEMDVICPGDSTGALTVQFTGGKLPAEYRILPDGKWQTDSVLTDLPEGQYAIVARDANGLETAPVTGIVGGPPAWMVTAAVIGNTIQVSAEGGTPPYLYDLEGLIDSTGIFTVAGYPATYTLVVTDSLGCQASIEVEVFPLGLEFHIMEEILCYGDSTASLLMEGLGGQPPYLYRLNGGIFQSQPIFTGLPAGEYTAEVMDVLGTTLEVGVINILQPDSLELVVQQVQDSVVQLTATGGTEPYQYQIGIGSVQDDPVFDGLPEGLYVFRVIDANGCITEVEVQVVNTALDDPSGLLKAVSVRPNPSDGRFELILPASLPGSWTWTMLDIVGRPVDTGTAQAGVQMVGCVDCPSGLYILQLRSASGNGVNLRVVIR